MTGILDEKEVEIAELEAPYDLETLPIGLYNTSESDLQDLFDGFHNGWLRGAHVRGFLRIDHGQDLPEGLQKSYFRRDGCRVIETWILDPALPEPELSPAKKQSTCQL